MNEWPGWSDTNTLVLALDAAPHRDPVVIAGRAFDPKSELHVTVVGRRQGAELRALFGDRLDAATRPAFEALDWRITRTGERRLIVRDGLRDDGLRGEVGSVIEPVELPALAHYYRWLGSLLGRQLPLPPPHITLYTHGRAGGIGIPSARALRAWSKGPVDVPR